MKPAKSTHFTPCDAICRITPLGSPPTNDTHLRQWAMLRVIPRSPRRIDAPAIHERLKDLGMAVSLRTVHRDQIDASTINHVPAFDLG